MKKLRESEEKVKLVHDSYDYKVFHGDCLEVMRGLKSDSVDSLIRG